MLLNSNQRDIIIWTDPYRLMIVSITIDIVFCSLITEYKDGDAENIYRVATK